MTGHNNHSNTVAEKRKLAEASVQIEALTDVSLSREDAIVRLQELRQYQVDLEMQILELQAAQKDFADSHANSEKKLRESERCGRA